MKNPYHYMIDYNHHINYIDVDQAWGILVKLGFPKSIKDNFYDMCNIIENLGAIWTASNSKKVKILKDYCEYLWLEINKQVTRPKRIEKAGAVYYITNPYQKICLFKKDLDYLLPYYWGGEENIEEEILSIMYPWFDAILEISRMNFPLGKYQRIIHTLLRMGEFLYISDDTMQDLTQDIDSFIESGDCRLFDDSKCPYKGNGLETNLIKDIYQQEDNIRKYNRDNNLADIKAKDIENALKKILEYSDCPEKAPENLRGVLLNLQSISENMQREGLFNLTKYYQDGIPDIDMFHKMSGSCYNKETNFQKFCEYNRIASFKNPETVGLIGKTGIVVPAGSLTDTFQFKCLRDCLMDCIWYSIGKGPWLKTRYVGQCSSFHQSLLAPYERVTRDTLKLNHRYYQNKEQMQSEGKWTWKKCRFAEYSNDPIFIYDNSSRLKELINGSSDLISSDFSAYTDYMNRNLLFFICRYLLKMPSENVLLISKLFSMPVRINGHNYHYKWGSVMGLKFNFLLITIANWLMWAIGVVLTHNYNTQVIVMGDDRLEGTMSDNGFSEDYLEVQLAVCSYMNCVINKSKTEWLRRDGFSSFCKIYHNIYSEEISGFGGESSLKQKVFINDFSTLINDSLRREFPMDNDNITEVLRDNLEILWVGYKEFKKTEDPSLKEMIGIAKKISYRYGGLNTEEPDDIQDKINMSAILSSINIILIEDLESTKDPNRIRVRSLLTHFMPNHENNIFVKNLDNNCLGHDFDKIKENISKVQTVLDNPLQDSSQILEARRACQRLQEIVLDRDARLSGSISTKNRQRPKFDQDRISKIRNKYYDESLVNDYQTGYLNSIITTSVMDDPNIGYSESIKTILDYYNYFKDNSSGLILYTRNQQESSFVGLKIVREGKTLIKRITSEDSNYRGYNNVPLNEAKFISYEWLSESERNLFDKIRSDKYLMNNLSAVAKRLDKEVETMQDYIRSYLLDSLTDSLTELM